MSTNNNNNNNGGNTSIFRKRDYNNAFVTEIEDVLTGRQRTEQLVNDVYENDNAGDDFLDFGLYMEEADEDNDTMHADAFLEEIDQPIQYIDEDNEEDEEEATFDDAVAEAVADSQNLDTGNIYTYLFLEAILIQTCLVI